MQSTRKAFSLVEILVVLVVLCLLAAVLMPMYLKGGKTAGGKKIDSPIQRGHAPECASNLNQIRQAYTMATTADDEQKPRALADLKRYGLTDSMLVCPAGKEPYRFDPATGRAWCVHPGHENFSRQ